MAKPTAQQIQDKIEKQEIDWTQNKPWGTVGVDLPKNASVEEILKAAKLNWKVERVKMHTNAGGEVPGFAALMRSDNKQVLDVCGSQYKPVQNADAFRFFKKFVEAGKAKLTEAGSLSDGRLVWASADLNNSFTIGKKDVIKCKLRLASPHEQGKSFKLRIEAYRLVCGNGVMGSVTEAFFRMSHRLEFTDDMMVQAEQVLGLANNNFDNLSATLIALSKKKVNRPAGISYFARVFDPQLGNAPPDDIMEKGNKATQLAIQALDNAPGHNLLGSEGTAWGLLNAVTYTTDHLLGHTVDGRLKKAWFGRTAALKQRAVQLAVQL